MARKPRRPRRISNAFFINNSLIDEHGSQIGAIGVAIYAVLARHADVHTGRCYPSIPTIAHAIAINETTVKRYMKKLVARGLVIHKPRWRADGGRSSDDYFLPDLPTIESLFQPEDGGCTEHPPPRAQRPRGGCTETHEQDSYQQIYTSGIENDPQDTSPTQKQLDCPHPKDTMYRFSDGTTICHRCYGMVNRPQGEAE